MANWSEWAARLRVRMHLPLAVVYLWFARPTPKLLLAGTAVIVLGLVVRGWAAGHLHKEGHVTVSGPYARVRHPLYFGTLILLAGFAVAGGSLWLPLLLAAYFGFFFVPVMRREERARLAGSSDFYALYRALVPALRPRLKPARFRQAVAQPQVRFQWVQYGKNYEWRAALGCTAVLLLLYAKIVLS